MFRVKYIFSSTVKKFFVLLLLSGAVQFVYAISGGNNAGGDEKSKNLAGGAFSNIKSSVTLSLKNSYHYKTNNSKAVFSDYKSNAIHNSVVTYKKGNMTYIISYKTKAVKLPSFIRRSPLPAGIR